MNKHCLLPLANAHYSIFDKIYSTLKSTFDIIGTIYYNNKWKYILHIEGRLRLTLDEIKVVGIAGAGTMGASMAQIFAQYGYTVIIL